MGGKWEGCSGWGTHVNPWLIHVNVWQNPLQYCKVISLQLIKKKVQSDGCTLPQQSCMGTEKPILGFKAKMTRD